MRDFENRLKGGHPNSLGNTIEVVEEVLADHTLFRELFNCYFSDDEVVRLRTSNAMKRVCKEEQHLLRPYIDRFLTEIATIDQASTQWTLSQLFGILEKDMSTKQRTKAKEIMKNNLANHQDWIVLNATMDTLGKWSKNDDTLKGWLKPHAERLMQDSRKSVAKRAGKLLQLLTSVLLMLSVASCSVNKNTTQASTSSGPVVAESSVVPYDSVLIEQTFNDYKNAILNDEGEEAANYVDSRTMAYYVDILEKTRTADSIAVESLGIMDKMMVFFVRHRTEEDLLKKFDGRQLFVHAVEEGMVGKESVVNNDIGKITIDGDFAKAQVLSQGRRMPMWYHFHKEDGQWKLDLTSLFPAAEYSFHQSLKNMEQDENEFL
ncbi:MAG: hypothetical protein AAFQ37_01735, partial [Bacteroidota bacterium]